MKLRAITIHNFRSVLDVDIEAHDYMLLVGANNAGKSTILNALRAFYDDLRWTTDDFPKAGTTDDESWVQLKFHLDNDEWAGLAEDVGFDLERYGHGFQRSVIYELIRLAPTFKDEKKADKKEFSPSFNLVLFEEPEAFLHPSQQENMAFHLRRLGEEKGQQVIITTHSPTFAGKAAEQIRQIVRVQRSNGATLTFQPKGKKITELFEQGGDLLKALEAFVANEAVPEDQKKKAKEMIANPPQGDIGIQEEQFRFQLWLDGERASLFFADKVLLLEGATERGLFNYLLANDWHDLSTQRICLVDVLGKYNFHRYMALMEAFGIPHGVMLDDDNGKKHYGAVNDLVKASVNGHSLTAPVEFADCLETFLGLPVPAKDKKPIEILKAVAGKQIAADKLEKLRKKFCKALAIA